MLSVMLKYAGTQAT